MEQACFYTRIWSQIRQVLKDYQILYFLRVLE